MEMNFFFHITFRSFIHILSQKGTQQCELYAAILTLIHTKQLRIFCLHPCILSLVLSEECKTCINIERGELITEVHIVTFVSKLYIFIIYFCYLRFLPQTRNTSEHPFCR